MNRDTLIRELHLAMLSGTKEEMEDSLWSTLDLMQGEEFLTERKLEFSYKIKGNEMFVSRKNKSITRATVNIAFHKAMELEGIVTGPKKLGTFGASYLYPIFKYLGIIKQPEG